MSSEKTKKFRKVGDKLAIKINEILHGDCIELLREIPDESVDLVLTDPPYGINFHSNYRTKSKLKSVEGIYNDGENNTEFLSEVVRELNRVLKNNRHFYWFTRWDRVPLQLPILEKYFAVKNAIIWKKNNWSMGDLQGAYAGQYEVILFAQKGRRKLNEVDGRKRHPDILEFDRVPTTKLRHSHEKPEDLIEFLIKKSSNPGELVIDPFAGSGTTAVCAKRLNRNFITIELDEYYVNVAKQRLYEEFPELNEGEATK